MININESYVAELVFQLATPGSEIRSATDCPMELSYLFVTNDNLLELFEKLSINNNSSEFNRLGRHKIQVLIDGACACVFRLTLCLEINIE